MLRYLPIVLLIVGCSDPTIHLPEPRPHTLVPDLDEKGSPIVPESVSTVSGRVRWEGDRPQIPAFRFPYLKPGQFSWQERINPLAPHIGQKSGVRQAIVWLRGENVRTSKPWPHGAPRIELHDTQIYGSQDGQNDLTTIIVQRGQDVEMVSHERVVQSLRARGANFFTLQFPDCDTPLSRSFDEPGFVELTSASNQFWARAFAFVVDHPYVTRTDADGRFILTDVPPGEYEVVCWMPNYLMDRQENDPETMMIARQWYRQPIEMVRKISVHANQKIEVPFTLTESHFLVQVNQSVVSR